MTGSDAHTNINIFEPAQKKYCWVKAIPSFEGMKEITFEPKSRVRIQELKPESKADYYVIDKVIINNDDFSSEPIPFNDQLTCIIGGKSTGKSLLLHNMAEAISPQQVAEKLKITNSTYYKLDDIRVIWRDGVVSKKDLTDVEKKIVYLPQTYLNKLKVTPRPKLFPPTIILMPSSYCVLSSNDTLEFRVRILIASSSCTIPLTYS